jgi:hypothetical protein
MVISASTNQTGLLQDTTSGHTDSLAVGDDFDISYQYSEGSGTTAQVLQGAWLTGSTGCMADKFQWRLHLLLC